MPFDFASAKTQIRRTVHATLGVSAFYAGHAEEIKARWHSKINRFGDLNEQSWAELIEGVHRVIFEAEVARSIPVVRGGEINFPDMGTDELPATFVLDAQEPSDGPFEEIWLVTFKAPAP